MSTRKFYGPPRTDFGPAPPGYIPGVGRGARAFSTRSDKGNLPVNEKVYVAQRGQGPAEIKREREKMLAQKKEQQSLFKTSEQTEDTFADEVYNAIDARMASRRKRKDPEPHSVPSSLFDNSLLATVQESTDGLLTVNASRPGGDKSGPVSYLDQFKELKQQLNQVSYSEWEALPDALDFSRRNTNSLEGRERFGAVTDSVILSQFASALSTAGSDVAAAVSVSGVPGISGTDDYDGPDLGLTLERGGAAQTSISLLKRKVAEQELSKLDKEDHLRRGVSIENEAEDLERIAKRQKLDESNTTTPTVSEVLTDDTLQSSAATVSVSDLAHQRLVFKSVLRSDPTNVSAWIAAVRLEKNVGNIKAARQLVQQGCEKCPTAEDLWIEWSSLEPSSARTILARAAVALPKSARIWTHSAQLEKSLAGRRAVLRRALELIPASVQLWKASVALERPSDARILLSRAVEVIPDNSDLWVALAKVETYANARAVLNRARFSLPGCPKIWIAATKLEETNGKPLEHIIRVFNSGLNALRNYAIKINAEIEASRDASGLNKELLPINPPCGVEFWLDEALLAEANELPFTSEAMIRAALNSWALAATSNNADINSARLHRIKLFCTSADDLEGRGGVVCPRVAYNLACEEDGENDTTWIERLYFEERCDMLTVDQGKDSDDHSSMSKTRDLSVGPSELYKTIELALRHCPSSAAIVLYAMKQMWKRGKFRASKGIFTHAADFINLLYRRDQQGLKSSQLASSLETLYITMAYLDFFNGNFMSALDSLKVGRERLASSSISHKLWIVNITLLQHIAFYVKNETEVDKEHDNAGEAIREEIQNQSNDLVHDALKLFPCCPEVYSIATKVALTQLSAQGRLSSRQVTRIDIVKAEPNVDSELTMSDRETLPFSLKSEVGVKEEIESVINTGNEERRISDLLPSSADLPLLATKASSVYSESDLRQLSLVRDLFKQGLNNCSSNAVLWMEYINFELFFSAHLPTSRVQSRVRALLETARSLNPASPDFAPLWTLSVALEHATGNSQGAAKLLSRAMSAIGNGRNVKSQVGQLYAYAIKIASRHQRKSKTLEALSICPESPEVFLAAAKLCWDEGRTKRIRPAFERAIAVDPLYGDSWVFLYAFVKANGTKNEANEVISRCIQVAPTYGVLWEKIAGQSLVNTRALHEVDLMEEDVNIQMELPIQKIVELCAEYINPLNVFGAPAEPW